VKQGVASLVRKAAGWPAITMETASLIERRMGNIRDGSCSQLAPSTSTPLPARIRAHSAGEWPSAVLVV